MKRFLIVVVLVGLGLGVYFLFFKHKETPKEPETETPVTVNPTPPDEPPLTTPGAKLFQEGKYKDAIRQLEKELKEASANDQPGLLNLLAQSYEKTENPAKALETWQKLTTDCPTSPLCGNAYYALGKAETDMAKQMDYYQTAVEKYPKSEGAKTAALDLGEIYYQAQDQPEADRFFKARHCFTLALKRGLPKDREAAVKDKLKTINNVLVFSRQATPDSIPYTVKQGDSLYSISNKNNIPPGNDQPDHPLWLGQIRRINHMATSFIRSGDTLKIIPPDKFKFRIEVDKKTLLLTLYLNDEFVREYPISVGDPKESPTPEGTYHILGKSKEVNPVWYRTDKTTGKTEKVLFGDKQHIIGTRWMPFKESTGLGIHGTNDPASIGKPETKTGGCIRLKNDDVEELFDLVGGGTEVTIRG